MKQGSKINRSHYLYNYMDALWNSPMPQCLYSTLLKILQQHWTVRGTTTYFFLFLPHIFCIKKKTKPKNYRRQGTTEKKNTLHAPFKDFYHLSRKLIHYLKLNSCIPQLSWPVCIPSMDVVDIYTFFCLNFLYCWSWHVLNRTIHTLL